MVFYFSATGNSKYVAKRLCKTFGGEMIDISRALKKKEFKYEAGEDEKVLFVLPVYYFGLPHIVMEFLSYVDFIGKEDTEVGAILTCGAMAGGADKMFIKALKLKNCKVRGVFQLVMPENNILLMNAPTREAQIMQLRKAEKELDEIIDSITYNYRVSYKSTLTMNLLTKAAYGFYKNGRKTKKFWVKDNCIGCGLCQTICPSETIIMEESLPVWERERCSLCLGCINRCPVEAIQYGKKTENRGRYVHKEIK